MRLYHGLVNLSTKTLSRLDQHRGVDRHPEKYGGLFFPKPNGIGSSDPIVFRFYRNDMKMSLDAYDGTAYAVVSDREYPNGELYFTVDLTPAEKQDPSRPELIIQLPAEARMNQQDTEVIIDSGNIKISISGLRG